MDKKDDQQKSIVSAQLAEHLQDQGSDDVIASPDSGLFADPEVRDTVAYLDAVAGASWIESDQRHAIMVGQRTKRLHQAVEEGNVTVMQQPLGYIETGLEEREALPLIVGILDQGAAQIYLWGSQGAGKSHMALWLSDVGCKFSNLSAVATNIPLSQDLVDFEFQPDDDVDLVLNGEVVHPDELAEVDRRSVDLELQVDGDDILPELRSEVSNPSGYPHSAVVKIASELQMKAVAAVLPGRVAEVVDEWGTKGGGHGGSNPNAGEMMVRHFKEMRHKPYRSVAIVIGHSPSDLEKDAREFLVDLGVFKPTQSVAQLYRSMSVDGGEDFITDVQVGGHDLDDYDDEGATYWSFDDTDDEDDEPDDPKKVRAQALKDAGWHVEDIADDVDMSTGWVSTHTSDDG